MKTLVIAAHPDDEVLGCGGVIATLVQAKVPVRVVIMGEGETSRGAEQGSLDQLRLAARAANEVLGVSDLHLEDLPDNKFDSVPMLEIVKRVERHVDDFKPERILTHSGTDLNVDHRVLHQACITASRPMPGQSVREVLFFEVRSSTEWNYSDVSVSFRPQIYWDISASLAQKKRALEKYASEMRDWPHSRSISAVEHLARHRGGEVGVDAAEAFAVGRILRSDI